MKILVRYPIPTENWMVLLNNVPGGKEVINLSILLSGYKMSMNVY